MGLGGHECGRKGKERQRSGKRISLFLDFNVRVRETERQTDVERQRDV